MASLVEAARNPDCPYEVVLVVSNVPDAPGLALAASNGIPTFAASHKGMKRAEFDRLVDGALRDAGVEYVALAGYMRLLSPEFVAGWSGRMINIHPSLLPLYRGLHTHERALADGARVDGCTVHFVTPGLDEGAAILQAEVPVLAGDTPETLAARILVEEHRIYPEALRLLALGAIPATPQ